ncbi:hypothetical protein F7Q99_20145 [Streptomyces kaniharaensis]|uniref:Phage head morphogenesis domain-containing protein n=1 Tax=Streptomyces kaniharaensis TaxID=212423 RepID=A0A6N7KY50_9ACTN|nr:hypothetical protein [Streptomyces kaniharaensis]MQS14513.1 hypothetical protein [Streptomyces kaniharaensis]
MADRAPTLALGRLAGTWAAVYRRRDQLEADASEQVLAAWRAVAAGLDLADIVTVLRDQVGPAETADQDRRRHLRQVTAAAVLARLAALARRPAWPGLITAITSVLRRARKAGRSAADAVIDDTGDTDLPDDGDDLNDPDEDLVAAYTITAAALRGTAQTIASNLLSAAEQGDDEQAMQDQADADLTTGAAWSIAAATASAAAFTTGMADAYQTRDVQQLDYVTAGDGRVCAACSNVEDRNPHPANSVPLPPLHPRCRCTLQPTRAT